MSFFSRRPKHAAITAIPEVWGVAQGNNQGQPMIIRYPQWAKSQVGHSDYPWRIGIAAPFGPGTDWCKANETESRHKQLEDRAIELLCSELQSVPALVITTPQFRELVFYCKSPERTEHTLNSLCGSFADIRAARIIERDPEWNVFLSLTPKSAK